MQSDFQQFGYYLFKALLVPLQVRRHNEGLWSGFPMLRVFNPDCFDIQSARPLNDYSGRYLIVPNVHKSNLFKLEDLLIKIKLWA
jgi:hypothetical protein